MQRGRCRVTNVSGEERRLGRELRRLDGKKLNVRFKKEGGLGMSHVRLEAFYKEFARRDMSVSE